MSQTLYEPVSTKPSKVVVQRSTDTVDKVVTLSFSDLFMNEVFQPSRARGMIREPRPAIKGTLATFRPRLHAVVPELAKLTEEDMEDLIDETDKLDFEDD